MSEPIRDLETAVPELGALPMPAGPEQQANDDCAKAPWGRGEDGRPLLPMGAHWTDIPELVDRTVAGIQSRVDQAQSGHWYVSPIAELPGTVCTRVDGYHRTVGQFPNVLPADLELVLHAHDDLRWCLDMIAKLRTRVANLETERHTTNEALSDAAEALREQRDQLAGLEALDQKLTAVEEGFEALKAQGQVLRESRRHVVEDDPFGLHHTYRVSRDLPELGGA